MANGNPLRFFSNRAVQVLTALLVLQAAGFYSISHGEVVPPRRSFQEFPLALGGWRLLQEGYIDKDTRDVLKADDLLSRTYANPAITGQASLFVAFFRSQRTGQAPHSPKNCLPGNGWVPSVSDVLHIAVPGRTGPVEANRYVISRGEDKSVVLYWYQSRDRTVASEYWAKFYVAADAVRYNRTDTALVRVVVPVRGERDVNKATEQAIDFVKSFYGPLRGFLPA